MKDVKSFLLLLACTVILFLFFYFPNKITDKDNAYRLLSELTAETQMKKDVYYFNFEINNKMTGMKAPDVLCSETKKDPKDKYLSELVCQKPLFIYRYTDINCNTCYEAELKALQEEFASTSELTTVLCSYRVDQKFVAFKRVNQIKLPLYRIPSDAFDWAVEGYNEPYYFILHPDMKISHIYVPNNDYPELNKQYFEGVKRFLSE